jgi:hypothetical protein
MSWCPETRPSPSCPDAAPMEFRVKLASSQPRMPESPPPVHAEQADPWPVSGP